MGSCLTVSAAGGNTITVTHSDTDKNGNKGTVQEITYDYYQILKADINSESNKAAYYVESLDLAKALAGTGYFKYQETTDANHVNILLADAYKDKDAEETGKAIGVALNKDSFKATAYSHGTFTNEQEDGTYGLSATSPDLEPGYYLVTSTLGTVAIVQTLNSVKIQEKNTYPGVHKTKQEKIDIYSMFGIGTELKYDIEVVIPASVANKAITVVDTATNGLTINLEKAITVTGGEGISSLNWEADTTTGTVDNKAATVYKAIIPADIVTKNAGKTLKLTYTATINENAVIYEPEKNTAHVEYDNFKSVETEPVIVKTIGFKILKYTKIDGTKTPLTGAEFSLWDAAEGGKKIEVVAVKEGVAGHYRVAKPGEKPADPKDSVIVVDDNGNAQVDGLEARNYYIQEDVAPLGYNKLDVRTEVTLQNEKVSNTEIKLVEVENNSGSLLPSTGGIGTTIFYILGGILIVAGVAYFIVRRKASAE